MASDKRSPFWPIVTAIVTVLCLVVAFPDSWKPWAPSFLKPGLHLGLDLAGGTQLDFRISEDEINARKAEVKAEIEKMKAEGNTAELSTKQFELQNIEEQHSKLLEAIRAVLERRINSLGVSEATITPSYFGSEKHLLVECPGVVDIDRCIATVGKTIRLEFKEPYTGDNAEYEKGMRTKIDEVFRAVTTGTGNLQVAGQDLSNQLGVSYIDVQPLFISSLPKGLEGLANRTANDPVVKNESTISTTVQGEDGTPQLAAIKGVYLTKILEDKKPMSRPLTDPAEAYDELAKTVAGAVRDSKFSVALDTVPQELRAGLQTMTIGTQEAVALANGEAAVVYLLGRTEGTQEMTASHILIQYKGAQRADASVTRTKEEAKSVVDAIAKRVAAGEKFNDIASKESDGPSKGQAGSIGVIRPGQLGSQFDTVAFALKQGQISAVTETPFGYHIIRADKAAAAAPAKVSYEALRLKGAVSEAEAILEKVEKGEVVRADQQIVVRTLFFSLEPTGWKDTELNGEHFRSAAVGTDNLGRPIVQIQFDEKGGELFYELTKRNVNKQIAIFVGGELVQAPNVNEPISAGSAQITGYASLEEAQTVAQNLNTGAIPAPIYLSGQSTVEATLGTTALQESVFAAAVGMLVLCLFMILIYRLLGVVASGALIVYVILLVASTKLPILLISNQYVVLTLAGIAGIILSMGMAVDANVLAFERVKEELRKGKTLKTSVETGFKKAWPSVRDGNTSTLITCAILFTIGTSIIRGFAVTLSIGIFMSLFTGIVVSRFLSRKLAESPLALRLGLFGVKKKDVPSPRTDLPQ